MPVLELLLYNFRTTFPSTIFSGGMQAYLEVGGDLKDLALSIENTICACGGGFFFFYGLIWW